MLLISQPSHLIPNNTFLAFPRPALCLALASALRLPLPLPCCLPCPSRSFTLLSVWCCPQPCPVHCLALSCLPKACPILLLPCLVLLCLDLISWEMEEGRKGKGVDTSKVCPGRGPMSMSMCCKREGGILCITFCLSVVPSVAPSVLPSARVGLWFLVPARARSLASSVVRFDSGP